VTVIFAAIAMGTLGKLANISDIVAYATILWVGGILLVSFGWKTGKHFWPPVLHLVYMLPLPGVLYFKLNTWLQLISSELGVFFLQLANVPVFLEGNIIDLGVLRLHVAEACSGLRYLFPILSFSYIFAVLYRGPMWHKAVLLISAAPITVLDELGPHRVAGIIAQRYGTDWLDGFTHFFEGWVIFITCVAILFLLAWVLLKLQRKMSLTEALDLETDGLMTQAARIRLVQPSAALIAAAGYRAGRACWPGRPCPTAALRTIARDSFAPVPAHLGDWEQDGPAESWRTPWPNDPERRRLPFRHPHARPTSRGRSLHGLVRGPEPGRRAQPRDLPARVRAGRSPGWSAPTSPPRWGPRRPSTSTARSSSANDTRMMVYYWFQQGERRIAWDFAAKFYLMVDGITTGSTDGALVRLTTLIEDESDADAEERLRLASGSG
jgi:exosortase